MIRLTAPIALIAYLIGGWILPATHQHGGGVGSHCGLVHSHSDDAHTAHDHAHDSACDHTGGPGPKAEHANVSGQGELDSAYLTAHHTHLCDGLCALCSARSLASAKWTVRPLAVASNCATERAIVTGVLWPEDGIPGFHYSRGPPAKV